MLPIAVHRLIYRCAPQRIRAHLKNSVPFGASRFTLTLPDREVLVFDHPECSKILRRFAWKGIQGHEPRTIRLFQRCAEGAAGVLDIGAYFGLYALIAAKSNPRAAVHAFEPEPGNIELLRHFLELNDATHVVVHPIAVARARGEATLYIPARRHSTLPPTGSLKNRFLPGQAFAGREAQTLRVRTAPLDDLIAEAGLEQIDLIKIDTEETELDVLAGGARTLARHRPDIIMEVIPSNPHADQAIGFLTQLGYRCFHIGPTALSPFDAGAPMNGAAGAGEIFCTCRAEGQIARLSR